MVNPPTGIYLALSVHGKQTHTIHFDEKILLCIAWCEKKVCGELHLHEHPAMKLSWKVIQTA